MFVTMNLKTGALDNGGFGMMIGNTEDRTAPFGVAYGNINLICDPQTLEPFDLDAFRSSPLARGRKR